MMKFTFLAAMVAVGFGSGCSGDSDSGGRGGNGNGNGGDGDFGNPGDGDTGTGGFGNGGGGTGAKGGGTGGYVDFGDQDFKVVGSYIWIANTIEGTVSKINTETMEEEGRYMTSPTGSGLPSRTAVSSSGHVAVANRGYAANPDQVALGGEAGVTKIYAGEVACEDRNGNGMIDTSTGKADVKPWMEDECIAWHLPLMWRSNRAVAWAPGAGPDLPEVLWTAGVEGMGTCSEGAPCTFKVLNLDGDTGTINQEVSVTSQRASMNFLNAGGNPLGFAVQDYGPYGGAADSGGNFWIFNGQNTELIYVPGADPTGWRSWPIDMANGYGITVGPNGGVFVCGKFGVSRFDPSTETWMTNGGGVALGFNGCMTDGGDYIWVGGGVDDGTPGLHQYKASDLSFVKSFDVGGAVKGVSVDKLGKVWGVGGLGAVGGGAGSENKAFRLDPTNGQVDVYDGLNGAYSYSDMTGFGLEGAGYTPVAPQ